MHRRFFLCESKMRFFTFHGDFSFSHRHSTAIAVNLIISHSSPVYRWISAIHLTFSWRFYDIINKFFYFRPPPLAFSSSHRHRHLHTIGFSSEKKIRHARNGISKEFIIILGSRYMAALCIQFEFDFMICCCVVLHKTLLTVTEEKACWQGVRIGVSWGSQFLWLFDEIVVVVAAALCLRFTLAYSPMMVMRCVLCFFMPLKSCVAVSFSLLAWKMRLRDFYLLCLPWVKSNTQPYISPFLFLFCWFATPKGLSSPSLTGEINNNKMFSKNQYLLLPHIPSSRDNNRIDTSNVTMSTNSSSSSDDAANMDTSTQSSLNQNFLMDGETHEQQENQIAIINDNDENFFQIFNQPMRFSTENNSVVVAQVGTTAHLPCMIHNIGEGVVSGIFNEICYIWF